MTARFSRINGIRAVIDRACSLCKAGFLTTILLAAATLAQGPLSSKPKLVYAVILSRHGVRPPTASNEAISQYAAEPWPDWTVAPGELTGHGRQLMGILGGWYRGWLADDGLLSGTGCEQTSAVHVRADVGQRTTESSRAFSSGMFPGCTIPVQVVNAEADPLFHPINAGLMRGDTALAVAAVSGRIGGHPEAIAPAFQHAFGVLNEILFGCRANVGEAELCAAAAQPGKQALLSLPASVNGTEDGLADIRGPIRTGSTMAENLLLEYTDGKKGKDLGWGRLDESRLTEVMAIHTAYADLARRTTYLAVVQGSNLLNTILNSMKQAASGKAVPGALGKPGDRLLLLGGHDTNISHVSGLLNISWLLPSYQRDDTPPGGSLVFRLWQGVDGGYKVETLHIAQTLNQMRDAAPLSRNVPPAIAPIFVPGCPATGPRYECDWEAFQHVVSAAIDSRYVRVQ
jgi:4-phytase / acid phosphatase